MEKEKIRRSGGYGRRRAVGVYRCVELVKSQVVTKETVHCNAVRTHCKDTARHSILDTAIHCNTLQHTATHCNTL